MHNFCPYAAVLYFFISSEINFADLPYLPNAWIVAIHLQAMIFAAAGGVCVRAVEAKITKFYGQMHNV